MMEPVIHLTGSRCVYLNTCTAQQHVVKVTSVLFTSTVWLACACSLLFIRAWSLWSQLHVHVAIYSKQCQNRQNMMHIFTAKSCIYTSSRSSYAWISEFLVHSKVCVEERGKPRLRLATPIDKARH